MRFQLRTGLVLTAVLLAATAGCIGDARDEGPEPVEPAETRTPAEPSNQTETNASGGNASTPQRNATTSSEADDASKEDGGEAGNRTARLPANVSMVDAAEVQRTNRSATFRWNGTLGAGEAPVNTSQASATTRVQIPPHRWLKINATVGSDQLAAELDVNLFLPEDARGEDGLCVKQEACEVRPPPRDAWSSWSVQVRSIHPGADANRTTPFSVELSIEVLEGPWSDVESAQSDGWPAIDSAAIRPGSDLYTLPDDCTVNFVFRSPDNSSLYLGTASHCVPWGLGSVVPVAGLPNAARVVYCSWGTRLAEGTQACPDSDEIPAPDFGLLEVRPTLRDEVHPAVRHWGGPTGLTVNVSRGDRVLTYGNSSLRDADRAPGFDAADPARGFVSDQGEWSTQVCLVAPSLPGDSGSPVLVANGTALGSMWTVNTRLAEGHTNSVATLGPALSFVDENSDLEPELVTWPLLKQPRFPSSPAAPPGGNSCAG